MKLSTLSLVHPVLCKMCIVCKLIWLNRSQTCLYLSKVNISLGSPDMLCSLCAELISSAGCCSVHMATMSRGLAERALPFTGQGGSSSVLQSASQRHNSFCKASRTRQQTKSMELSSLWYEAPTSKTKPALASCLAVSELPAGQC